MSPEVELLLGASVIFLLRVVGIAVFTVRMLILVQGRKLASSALGFVESVMFAVALGSVVTQLDNIVNLTAYSLGFSVGTYIGMVIEARFFVNFHTLTIVSQHRAHEIASAIRDAGFGATETWGQGGEGLVGSVRVVLRRQDMQGVIQIVNAIDANAFVTYEETRGVRHGYFAQRQRPVR